MEIRITCCGILFEFGISLSGQVSSVNNAVINSDGGICEIQKYACSLRKWRNAGMDFVWHCQSPLGGITLSSDGKALAGLWFDGQKYFGENLSKDCEEKSLPIFDQTMRWLDVYFSGKVPDFTPPILMRTTPFRKKVWEILQTIPFGKTITYGEIARKVMELSGVSKMSAQAVGNAVGHNAIALIIPCHRVVGADGGLTGYAGGIDKKAWLLALEKRKRL